MGGTGEGFEVGTTSSTAWLPCWGPGGLARELPAGPTLWQRQTPGSTGRSSRRGKSPGSLGRRQAGAGAGLAGSTPAGRAGTRLTCPGKGAPRAPLALGMAQEIPSSRLVTQVPAQVSPLRVQPFGRRTWRCHLMARWPDTVASSPETRGNPHPASHIPSTAALQVSRQRRPLAGLFLAFMQFHPSNTCPHAYLVAMHSWDWLPGEECTPFCLFLDSGWVISFDAP